MRPTGQMPEWAMDRTRYLIGDKVGSLLCPCGSLKNVKHLGLTPLGPAQDLVSFSLMMSILIFCRRDETLISKSR